MRTRAALDVDDDNERTFRRVFHKGGPFVYRTLQQLGVRLHDLDDMFHDVFIVVHTRLDSLYPNVSIKSWLYGICKNTVLNYRRSTRWRCEVLVADVPELDFGGAEQNPEQLILAREWNKEQQQLLTELLDELKLDERAIIVMRYIDGMRYAEIAEVLDIPIGTVGSQRSAAIKALRRALVFRKIRSSKGGRK